MMCLVKCYGHCLVVVSKLPLSGNTLIYGSANAAVDIKSKHFVHERVIVNMNYQPTATIWRPCWSKWRRHSTWSHIKCSRRAPSCWRHCTVQSILRVIKDSMDGIMSWTPLDCSLLPHLLPSKISGVRLLMILMHCFQSEGLSLVQVVETWARQSQSSPAQFWRIQHLWQT